MTECARPIASPAVATRRTTRTAAHPIGVAGLASALILIGCASARSAALGTCTIVVETPGVLKVSPDLMTLSSTNPGGSSARARVTAQAGGGVPALLCNLGLPLNCFTLSVVQPAGFTIAPNAADPTLSFSGGWRTLGSSAALNLLSAVILNGTHSLELDLTATKATGVFSAGTYQAQQTIRCE